jgi:hypothetical protein
VAGVGIDQGSVKIEKEAGAAAQESREVEGQLPRVQ